MPFRKSNQPMSRRQISQKDSPIHSLITNIKTWIKWNAITTNLIKGLFTRLIHQNFIGTQSIRIKKQTHNNYYCQRVEFLVNLHHLWPVFLLAFYCDIYFSHFSWIINFCVIIIAWISTTRRLHLSFFFGIHVLVVHKSCTFNDDEEEINWYRKQD